MSETTIVALVILGGVFVVMSITIYMHGPEAAIKMWGVMGALTGVAFGGITSFYFTNKSSQQEISQVRAEKAAVELKLSNAATYAVDVNKIVSPWVSALKGEQTSASFPINTKLVRSIPEGERAVLADRFERATMKLQEINKLQAKIKESESDAVEK